jgi:hypothetical protein
MGRKLKKVITVGIAKQVWHCRLRNHWGPKQIAAELNLTEQAVRKVLYCGRYEVEKAHVIRERERMLK